MASPACLKLNDSGASSGGDGEDLASIPTSGTGRNATVIATATNSLARCSFTQMGLVEFSLECAVVVVQNNQELVANEAENVEFNWGTPSRVSGAEILTSTCESGYKNLSHNCDLVLDEPRTTEVEVGLLRTNTVTTEADELSALVLLAYSVSSYGLVPQIPIAFNPGPRGLLGLSGKDRSEMGFATRSFVADNISVDEIKSQCWDGTHKISTEGYIYSRNATTGRAEIFAGTANTLNTLDYPNTEHRLRVHFEPGDLFLACSPAKPNLLYVLVRQKGVDPNGYYVPDALLKIYKIENDMVSVVVRANPGEGEYNWLTPPLVEAAVNANLDSLGGGAVGDDGALYFSEPGRGIVRKLDADGGNIHLYAGAGPCATYNPDPDENGNDQNPPWCTFTGNGYLDGPISQSLLSSPKGLAYHNGKLYIADEMNRRIRVAENGMVSTFAGGGTQTTDGASPLAAQLGYLQDVSVDSAGTIYIADSDVNRIKKIENNQVITIVGSGDEGNPSHGDSALSAAVFHPFSVVSGSPSQVYFAFQLFEQVSPAPNGRRVFGLNESNELKVVFGEATIDLNLSPDTRFAQLREASGIAFHPNGDIYYTDAQNHLVMRIHKGSRGQDVVSRFAGIGLSGCTNVLGGNPATLVLN
ncbi:MAG: hypothetical protein KDD39_10665, partial [Bdellovibrionales bacterium]|nr:hypothetical protein [Bdellovibrionales bacterium]